MGYKYYDKKGVKVRYPFGYGLSYTNFTYSNLTLKEKEDGVYAVFDIKNDGAGSGKEIAQVYVGYQKAGKNEPVRVLAGFDKYFIEAGKTKTVEIKINPRAFEVFDESSATFQKRVGKYKVWVGANSRDLPLSKEYNV